ncbi:MAG: DUF4395 domain-containing protein [Actinobacteria bacterium]|nr:DUF4395 domain-containing protein [Actinomycetota bacterium]
MDPKRLLSFPDPVNEVAARLVAGGVVLMAGVTLAFQAEWMLWVLAYGFVARVCTGPTLSPLGQLVTRVLVPALPFAEKPVPGPPKRFAQGIGALVTVSAVILAGGFGQVGAAYGLIAVLTIAAGLEAFVGFCLGCKVFALLMKVGVIPETVCERCNDIWAGQPPAVSTGR